MEMFNKLRSAVSSALPGIPLTKDFDVQNPVGSGGPGLVWKIYTAVKKSTKEEASVFVFEKKYLERYPKKDRDVITETLKKGISQLTRLRHPRVLSVVHPLEESRETLAFATEPVFASLANVLGNHDNLPTPVPSDLEEYKLYDVEIKHGLLQVTEGLGFLHRDAKIMHNNLCPESIIINKSGTWKLAGFDCCITNANKQDQTPMYPFREWDPELPPIIQPHLDYLAPEFALTLTCSEASDMFSVGVLIHAIYNNGKPLYECKQQLSLFKKYAEELRKFRSSLLGSVPESLQQYVKLLLNTEPTVRPDPDQLTKIEFFEDVGSMTLQYMDTLFQKDNLQKSQFFKGLPKILPQLPKRVNLQRILPALVKECVNSDMIPFVLPNLLLMAEQATDREYTTVILPHLIPLFRVKDPIQVLLIFMQNMNLLLKKTPQSDIKNHVLPMIHQAMEADNPQLQEMCLKIVPTFADLVEFSALKHSIIPRIKKISLATSTLSVRINCLLCLGKLLDYMDKWTVLDDILPLLPQIPSREPAVLMGILGIYQVTLTSSKLGITKEILATKVLPFIIPLAVDNNLNLSQFNAFMNVVRDMISRLESEHRTKLEQLNQMKQEQKTLEITKFTADKKKDSVPEGGQRSNSMMDQFLSQLDSSPSSARKAESQRSPSPATTVTNSNTDPTRTAHTKKPLTLEEKQRLAQQQEQQTRYKAQKPINPSAGKPTDRKAGGDNRQVTDLTSTLMSSNVMQLNSVSTNPNPSRGSQFQGSANFSPVNMGQSAIRGPNYNVGQFGVAQQNSTNSTSLSSLDSLLSTSTQQKMTLNQMQRTGTPKQSDVNMGMSSAGQSPMMQQRGSPMMQQRGMMGNQGMMRFPGSAPMGMTGGQSAMGLLQPNPASMQFSNVPNQNVPFNQSIGNQFLNQSNVSDTSQFMMPSQGNTASAANDLKDIFG